MMMIYESGNYVAADLQNLQILIDEVGEIHGDAMIAFNKKKKRNGKRKM